LDVVGRVGSRLRRHVATGTARRHALRRRLVGVGRDALVAVGSAALGVAVSNGGVFGWTAAFAFAISLPVLAMELAAAVYERVGD
jgi:hypothetical protein